MNKFAVFTGSDMRTFGGGEKYVMELINRLKDFDTTIFSYRGRPPFRQTAAQVKKMVNAKIEYYSAPEVPLFKERIMLSISGIKALRELKDFNVVYCLDNSFLTNMLLCMYSKKYGFKYILGVHDANILREEPIKATLARKIILKIYSPIRNWGLMNAPNIRVINNADGKKLRRLGYRGKIYSITDFVNVDKAKPEVGRDKFVALFVGRLSIEHKGIDLLAKIIERTLERNRSICFNIVGSGDDGEGLVNDLVKRYPNNVKWLGFVSEEGLVREYGMAELLVFPSRFESFGLSLAEGQAYGLPAIAFDVRGPDVIMKNRLQGKLIKPFNTDDFVSEIIKYYEYWTSDKTSYLLLKHKISEIVIGRFGENTILPMVKSMLSTREKGYR